jgi:hypothetical protein
VARGIRPEGPARATITALVAALAIAFGYGRSLFIRSFNVTTALWQGLDQNSNPLQMLHSLQTTLIAGELPNPSPDYPYMGWQGELRPGQERRGTVLFATPPSTKKMRVRFTQPVMSPPVAE